MRFQVTAISAGMELHLEEQAPGFPYVGWDPEAGQLHLIFGRCFGGGVALEMCLSRTEARELWTRLREEYARGGGERREAAYRQVAEENERRVAERAVELTARPAGSA